ncbi:MAG: LAGLIDADG family homing endonuclease [Nitrososphaerales archaeon]
MKKPVKELGSFIEHSEQCIRGFLRGFFDSEGGVSGGALNASNTDTTLILLVLSLLQAIGIQTPGPYLGSKGNRFVTIKGQVHRANADCLVVRVRNCSRQVFLERVGFNIKRKRDRLILALGTKKT